MTDENIYRQLAEMAEESQYNDIDPGETGDWIVTFYGDNGYVAYKPPGFEGWTQLGVNAERIVHKNEATVCARKMSEHGTNGAYAAISLATDETITYRNGKVVSGRDDSAELREIKSSLSIVADRCGNMVDEIRPLGASLVQIQESVAVGAPNVDEIMRYLSNAMDAIRQAERLSRALTKD